MAVGISPLAPERAYFDFAAPVTWDNLRCAAPITVESLQRFEAYMTDGYYMAVTAWAPYNEIHYPPRIEWRLHFLEASRHALIKT